MSILDNNRPDRVETPKAKIAANLLIRMTKQTYQQMVQSFNQGAQIFWKNGMGATPSEIAAELGEDAKEVFELHHKLGQLIATVKPEAIAEGVDLVGNFIINEDSTVTIVEPETPVSPE
jgi:ABC-type Fe3+-citrate transport system substrate-binding protein